MYLFSIDMRALAIFRIALGLLTLQVMVEFLPYTSLFLSDAGVFPRAMAQSSTMEGYSLFYLHGSATYAFALLLVGVMASLALIVGFSTRLATICCWVIMVSLYARAGPIAYGGEAQLAVMLFWAMFLPLSARFLAPLPAIPTRHLSVASAILLLQISYIYGFGALEKTGDAWRLNFTAVEAALRNVHMATRASYVLLQWPHFMEFLTKAIWWLELLTPMLLFFPWRNTIVRSITLVALAIMHVGFLIFLNVSHFPWVSLAGLVLFIPTPMWDALMRLRAGRTLQKLDTRLAQITLRLPTLQIRVSVPPLAMHGPLIALFAIITAWNLQNAFPVHLPNIPTWAERTLAGLRMGPRWRMFAPYPAKNSHWARLTGTFEDGSVRELTGLSLSAQPPRISSEAYASTRWCTLMDRYDWRHHSTFTSAMCAHWPEMQSLTVARYSRSNPIGAAPQHPPAHVQLRMHLQVPCSR